MQMTALCAYELNKFPVYISACPVGIPGAELSCTEKTDLGPFINFEQSAQANI